MSDEIAVAHFVENRVRQVRGGMENVKGYKPRGLAGLRSRRGVAAEVDELGLPAAMRRQLLTPPKPLDRAVDAAFPAFRKIEGLESVLDEDDRTLVSDPTDKPWRWICSLSINTPGGRYVGTGWLIGPRTVMTAGHCVYIHDHGGFPTSIEVTPALDGTSKPYQSVTVGPESLKAPDEWRKDRNSDFDYGAILLDVDKGDETGWFGFAAFEDTILQSTIANISGYPADLDRATRQYFHARTIMRESSRRLYYDIDTYGGQSGSPIWINTPDGDRVAVGIHTTGASTINSGTRITEKVFADMHEWKKAKG